MQNLVIAAIFVLMIDQATKWFVVRSLAEGQFLGKAWPRIRRITNARGSVRLVERRTTLLALWSVTLLAIMLLSLFTLHSHHPLAQISLGVACGGATSNVCDRLWRKGVIDFLDFRFWPVFNLADVAIVVGGCSALYLLWFIS
jgi:signal peptidase II